jgi:hypothetical protein
LNTRSSRSILTLCVMRLCVYFVKARTMWFFSLFMSWNRAKVQLKRVRAKKRQKNFTCVFSKQNEGKNSKSLSRLAFFCF